LNRIVVAAVDSAAAIDHGDWSRLCPPGDPFLNGDFLSILERHGTAGRACGWQATHLVAKDAGGAVLGILPLYLRGNTYGDFTGDWSWENAYRQVGLDYYPKLLSGLPHTPATGPRLLVCPGPAGAAVSGGLIDAAKDRVAEQGLSSWHVAFPAESEIPLLTDAGLLIGAHVQFHWLDRGFGDFDGYLGSFNAESRRKVKAQRRRVAESGLVIETCHGDQIDPAEWPLLHRIYASTFEKFGNWAVFTVDGFAELAAALGHRMVLFIARDRGAPVAAAICFRGNETLYGRYWGTLADYHSLHFELCFYQGIAYCLREGLTRFEPGAGGEHKVARGFSPTLVHSAHWIADPAMRAAIGRHLERQRQAIDHYRDEATGHLPFRGDEM
jgi:predicted N-acyltransferase